MAKVVQYGSIESVVNAYLDNDYPCFAVFQDRQFMFKWRGDDQQEGSIFLEKRLTDWKTVDAGCVYTLAMFEDFPASGVKYTSVPDASFNFRINDSMPGLSGISGTPSPADYTALAVENQRLRMLLAQFEEEEGEGYKQDVLLGAIDKIMAIPGVDGLIGAIASKGAEFVQSIGNKNGGLPNDAQIVDDRGNPIHVRRVSGVPSHAINGNRLYTSVDELAAIIPDAADLLEKLVRMHKRDPLKFKFFVAGLRGMKY